MNILRDQYQWFESAIRSLEQALGLRVTVIDNQGIFHTPAGKLIFPAMRQSHRKLAVCHCGFSQRCIDFCRHAMNRESLRHRAAFTKHCWKGLTEIVIPLRRGEQHWGMLYLGIWRGAPPRQKAELPGEFDALRQALPRWKREHFQALAPLLEAFAAGFVNRLAELHAVGQPPLDRAARIAGYIHREAASPQAGITGLSRELHLSASRTSHLIRQYFERGFCDLLNEERIRRAKVLLLSTSDKLAAIAAATGFCDEYHFSKVFRNQTGMPPGQFRKKRAN